MAYKKISGMTAGTTIVATDTFEAVQSSNSVYVTAEQLRTFALARAYTTGWVDGGTDWTDKEITITHNLGKPVEDLVINAFLADGAGGTAAAALVNASTGSTDYGHTFLAVDTNSFTFHTATNGIIHVIDSGGVAVIDGEQRHYKVNVYYFGI